MRGQRPRADSRPRRHQRLLLPELPRQAALTCPYAKQPTGSSKRFLYANVCLLYCIAYTIPVYTFILIVFEKTRSCLYFYLSRRKASSGTAKAPSLHISTTRIQRTDARVPLPAANCHRSSARQPAL